MNFHKKTLDNGLTVIAELNPHVHSVAVGFYVRTGSRDESAEESGVSHFLEHMAFKGNDRYTADDINRKFDDIGAESNASTSEEITTFHTAVLPEYLPVAFELLAALMMPALREEDFDLEKNVILEEIAMYEDSPFWVAYEKALTEHFQGHPLERLILGTTESISALTAAQMQQYHAEHYKAGNIVLAVAGNTDWDQVLKLAETYSASWPEGALDRDIREARPRPSRSIIPQERWFQQHVLSLAPAPSATSPFWPAPQVLSVIVGDNVSSRLYWELLDPGHAEAAMLWHHDFEGSGFYGTYLCSDPGSTEENLARIHNVYQDINQNGITETELAQAKSKFASRIVLSSERPVGRRESLAENWIYRQEYRTVEDDLKAVDSLSVNDFRECLDAYPLGESTTVAVGPLTSLNGK